MNIFFSKKQNLFVLGPGVCVWGLPLAYKTKLHARNGIYIEPNAYRRNWMMSHSVMVVFFFFFVVRLVPFFLPIWRCRNKKKIFSNTFTRTRHRQIDIDSILYKIFSSEIAMKEKKIILNRTNSLFVSLRLLQFFFLCVWFFFHSFLSLSTKLHFDEVIPKMPRTLPSL